MLFTLVDSAEVVYSRYVKRLTRSERVRLWDDYRVVGRLFGLDDSEMPADLDELALYRRQMLQGDRLHVSDWARERAREIVFEPPVPLAVKPLVETANFITIALLPDRIREQYGFATVPPIGLRRALVGVGSEYVKRVLLPVVPPRLRLIPQVR